MKWTAVAEELPVFLENLYRLYQSLNEGAVADYIPELAQANPNWFGIGVVTVEGQVYNVGDTSELFTMQSISKPFVYGLALEDCGIESVLTKVGVEPTGEPFNELLESEEIEERKYNPMVNAGAIVTTSLIEGANLGEKRARLQQMFRRYIGRDIEVDRAVFHSKKMTDNLNRAIAYLMVNCGLIEGNIEEILDLYFTQCSLKVNCQDLAVMAATLANGGINPLTGERALDRRYVKHLLSVMYTCGLYDFSGQWAYRVGLPAKSGLSGAILAVVPGCLGIAVFSPPLEEHRKSLRGLKIFEALSEHFQLHLFHDGATVRDRNGHQAIVTAPEPIIEDSYPTLLDDIPVRDRSAVHQFLTSPSTQLTQIEQANGGSEALQDCLEQLHAKYLPLRDGKIYVSEPDLANIDPDWFGICIATVDGRIYEVGNSHQSFLIQSISKVFAYGLALEDYGRDYVLTKIDVEPTGDAYNSIIKVEENTKRPYNPMINIGAIATTSLIKGKGPAHRLNRVLEMYRRYVGHPVFVDTPTLVSEQTQGDRNWAISYLLRNFGMISGEIAQILNLYLQQCSVLIDCCDLAVMGATLANYGINPMTGERAIDTRYVRDLLSVMYTCGMYDFAGEWSYNVGFPAKSGVGGGIIAVVPGQMGIAVFSPPLDKRGNSIRGIKVCEELSRHFGLHIFEPRD